MKKFMPTATNKHLCHCIWLTATLQPFDLQRPTIPLWKDLKLDVNTLLAQEHGNIFKIRFALSRLHQFNNVYLLRGCFVFLSIVAIERFLCLCAHFSKKFQVMLTLRSCKSNKRRVSALAHMTWYVKKFMPTATNKQLRCGINSGSISQNE